MFSVWRNSITFSFPLIISPLQEYTIAVDEKGFSHRRIIELGLESEDMLEVTAGLELGEKVVTAGQHFLTDGEQVRIVD